MRPYCTRPVTEALSYIEAHLTQRLDLKIVAHAVHYSKYYLHRRFTEAVGMTMHDYIARRRLTEAGKLLVFSPMPIAQIAALAGYESQQAFTDSFTAMYKQSPLRFRKRESYYPLQLPFAFDPADIPPPSAGTAPRRITAASRADTAQWMALVRLVVDGFPHLDETQYQAALARRMDKKEALMMYSGETAIGLLLFSRASASIDFLGVHPLYRDQNVPRAFLEEALCPLFRGRPITTTTYREGDRADTGHRQSLLALGFAEAELLTEFGYPTQRLVLPPSEEAHNE